MQRDRDNYIVQSNRLSEASHGNLSLREARVIQLAILCTKRNLEESKPLSPVYIHSSLYSEIFYVARGVGYATLIKVAKTIGSREIGFLDEKEKGLAHKWFKSVEYQEGSGVLKLEFSDVALKELPSGDDQLEKKGYNQYNLKNTAVLDGVYATRMYEILNPWKHLRKTPWISIETLRYQFGLPDDRYLRMADLKRLVIDQALGRINTLTTMQVTYIQEKQGRVITSIRFKFHRKNRRGKPPTPAQLKAEFLASKEKENADND
jgi:plasmid replication initiation protein